MAYQAHKKRGNSRREPKEFQEEVVQIDRVTRVVKGGRKLRFRATVVVGNKKGKVGIGIGKSHEVTGAIQKAITKAKRELVTIKMDGTTIPHDIKIKFKAAKILLMPAAPGTGIIAGGSIRQVVELAGIKDILSKSFGTTNKVNTTKATFLALGKLKETPYMKSRAKKTPLKTAKGETDKGQKPTQHKSGKQENDKQPKTPKKPTNIKPETKEQPKKSQPTK